MDDGPTLLTLYVDAICVAGNYFISRDQHFVLWPTLNHDCAGFEVLEFATFNGDVSIDGNDTCC